MSVFDHLEFRDLRYIITVAETGSFTATARNANVAQSAISRQIGEVADWPVAVLVARTAKRRGSDRETRVSLCRSRRRRRPPSNQSLLNNCSV